MRKPTIRRLFAYIIDAIIISVIASALASVKVLNPYYAKYELATENFEIVVEEATKDTKALNELMNNNELTDLTYEISKYGVFSSIYSVVLTFLYFVGFQYFTKGKTLGKKIFGIEIVSNDKEELTAMQLLKRSIVIHALVTSIISIVLIMTLSKANYLNYARYVQLVETILILGSIMFALYREDGRGLHDLIAGTIVLLLGTSSYLKVIIKGKRETN